VVVLIDPGMGPRRVFRCLDQVDPEGFVAIPPVQALRVLSFRRFPNARFNVTVGRRWFWGGATYDELQDSGFGIRDSGDNHTPPLWKGGPGGVALPNVDSPLA